ncbi:MAG: hypothetical protein WD872_02740 [Pirellulaceae bacterium]
MHRWLSGLLTLLAPLLSATVSVGNSPGDDQAQLAQVQQLVGHWRGVGQPKRGSTQDSWVAEADWVWSFAGGPALVGKLPQGKFFRSVKLVPGEETGSYLLTATPVAEGPEMQFAGKLDEAQRLVLTALEPRAGMPERLSFRFVAGGNRLLLLLERKSATSDQYVRLAEVGYTRQGSGFGKGSSQPECVVTGGLGTIEALHAGQKYFVCCTGCLEYFKASPDEVIADYQARQAAEKAESKP